jgi:hypothetical protein
MLERKVNEMHWRTAASLWSHHHSAADGTTVPISELVEHWPKQCWLSAEEVEAVTERRAVIRPDEIAENVEEFLAAWRWAMSEGGAPDVGPGEDFCVPDLDWAQRPGRRAITVIKLRES